MLEEKIHHVGVADIISELLVIALDVEGAIELLELEVDVRKAQEAGKAVHDALGPDEQVGATNGKPSQQCRNMVGRLILAATGFVLVIKDDHADPVIFAA